MANTVTARIESNDPDQNGRLVEVDLAASAGAIAVTDGTTTVEGVTTLSMQGPLVEGDGSEASVNSGVTVVDHPDGLIKRVTVIDNADVERARLELAPDGKADLDVWHADGDHAGELHLRPVGLFIDVNRNAEDETGHNVLNMDGTGIQLRNHADPIGDIYHQFKATPTELSLTIGPLGSPTVALTLTAAGISVTGVPTSDPAVAGQLWNDAGTLKVSAG